MQWGKDLEYLQGLAELDPANPPQALLDRPELADDLAEVLAAFWLLSPGRVLGFGMAGGIPFADIAAFCRLFRIDDPGPFVRWIRELDGEFLASANNGDKGEG